LPLPVFSRLAAQRIAARFFFPSIESTPSHAISHIWSTTLRTASRAGGSHRSSCSAFAAPELADSPQDIALNRRPIARLAATMAIVHAAGAPHADQPATLDMPSSSPAVGGRRNADRRACGAGVLGPRAPEVRGQVRQHTGGGASIPVGDFLERLCDRRLHRPGSDHVDALAARRQTQHGSTPIASVLDSHEQPLGDQSLEHTGERARMDVENDGQFSR
jgi:hypothetical protein